MRALICICGHPRSLERRRSRLHREQACFEKSLALAVQRREAADSQVNIDRLSGVFAGKEQHIALAERISWTENIVQALPRPRR